MSGQPDATLWISSGEEGGRVWFAIGDNTIKVVIVRFRRELSRGVTYKIDYKYNINADKA